MDIKAYISWKLNEEQTKAALHTDTSSLIIAWAGSWKTRVLTYKIAYLIWGKHVPVQRILAVTFTNKAANEMKERIINIAQDISKEPSTEMTTGTDSIDDFLKAINTTSNQQLTGFHSSTLKWIGTFHSIFLKILKEDIKHLGMKYTTSFGILDTNDTQSIIRDVLKRLNLQEIFKVAEVKGFISHQKNNGNDPKMFLKHVWSDYDQSMFKIYEEYQKSLESSNNLDFDDLLLLPHMLFTKHPDILQKWQNKFSYILVDEAQDTNWIQFELMKMLSWNASNITLIGDDFQSIYWWRGALMENFLNVKKYRPDIQMFKLQINYRSRPHIVHAGNQIIKNNQNQYEKTIVPYRTGDDKIVCFSHNTEMDEAANIVDFIKKTKAQGKLKKRWSVAILYRTNAQSSPFEQLFLQEWIPYKVRWAFKFFERKEIKDTLAYLKYFLNPQDNVSLKRIINVPERSIGKTTIEHLEEYALHNNITLTETLEIAETIGIRLTSKAKLGIQSFLDTTTSLLTGIEKWKPAEVIEHLMSKLGYRNYLVKEEWWETQADEKYENIGQLINMAEKYIETWSEALRQFMEEVSLLSDISETENWDIDAVKLMTVHSSKWLEFPLVFVAGLEDYVFPLANAMMEPRLLEEERRLMYVAITRAQDQLFLSHAYSRMTRWQTKSNPASRFIDEIDPNLLKKYDLWWGWIDRDEWPTIDEWDTVKHKLFWTWYVIEVWNNLAIVRFHNPKFWVRKIEKRFLHVL